MEQNTMEGKDKHYLNWITIENLVNTLYRVIIESEKKFDNIYGFPVTITSLIYY